MIYRYNGTDDCPKYLTKDYFMVMIPRKLRHWMQMQPCLVLDGATYLSFFGTKIHTEAPPRQL